MVTERQRTQCAQNHSQVFVAFFHQPFGHHRQTMLRCTLKRPTQSKVLNGVTRDRHLRKHHKISTLTGSFTRKINNLVNVPRDVTHTGVNLGNSHSHIGHSTTLLRLLEIFRVVTRKIHRLSGKM